MEKAISAGGYFGIVETGRLQRYWSNYCQGELSVTDEDRQQYFKKKR